MLAFLFKLQNTLIGKFSKTQFRSYYTQVSDNIVMDLLLLFNESPRRKRTGYQLNSILFSPQGAGELYPIEIKFINLSKQKTGNVNFFLR